jgi:hypothetical protein
LRWSRGAARWLLCTLAISAEIAAQSALAAQSSPTAQPAPTARGAPFPGYTLHDAQQRDRFLVQRWVSADSPEISPAGMCDCIVDVYLDNRLVLQLGTPGDISAITIDEAAGRDLDGDGHTDLVVSTWSGGMHCCYSVSAYSVACKVRTLLSLDTGDCGPGEFSDLDHDGVSEFLTCDESWKDRYCSFALAPFPTVVYAYDAAQRRYRVATPKYARHFDAEIATERAEAERQIEQGAATDAGDAKCVVLHPVLGLMYTGRMAEGLAAISQLYKGADLNAFLKETEAAVRASPLWASR